MKTFAQERSADSRTRQSSPEYAALDLSRPAFDFSGASAATIFRKASCPCGGGCSACQSQSDNLKVSQPTDATEIEADRLADRVMRMPASESPTLGTQSHEPDKLHAKCAECDEESEAETALHKEGSVAAADAPPDDGASSVRSVANSGGSALDPATRSFFEPRFGMDLGHVRIHSDSRASESARSVNARAYTFGNSIAFGAGEYQPHAGDGKQLLAHELSHVALHGGGSPQVHRPEVHRKAASQGLSQVPAVPSSVESAIRQPGQPLVEPLRGRAENFFGHDLGHVRIHNDSLAATAVAENRAHAISAGPHILLSRHRSDLSRSESQRTLAHEIAHTLQPHSRTDSGEPFDTEGSDAETAAHTASEAFLAGSARHDASASPPIRSGLSKERDPRLDALVGLIDGMPLVLSERGIAETLQEAVPDLDLADPDNFNPLILLLDEHFGGGAGEGVFSEWYLLRSGPAASGAVAPARSAAPAVRPVIAPASMSATELEAEIAELRSTMDMPPLVVDAPMESSFEPQNAEDRRRLDRLLALETEYYDRRGLLETMREATSRMAEQQRATGIGAMDVVDLAVGAVTRPEMLSMDIAGTVLGHPVEDLTTGFLAGFLGGAVLELPRDVFVRLDAETREHPILFNGGILAGAPVGALQGLRDMVVGLYELVELISRFTPEALLMRAAEDAYRMITDREAYTAERRQQYEQAMAIGEAIVSLVESMFNDPAFMLAHGRELGEIAGRASAQWFDEDFMERKTFDKGYAVGKVEGRIIFEIAALFIGPEEWIARGAAAVGEVARISGPLRRAILEFIERFPALRRLLLAAREAGTVARETVVAERAVTEGGEVLSDATRASEGVSDLSRGGTATDEGARALEGTADEARGASRAADEPAAPRESSSASPEARGLDPGDLREVGEVNPETMQFFRENPDRLHAWATNPEARRVCKLCNTPCFPENVTSGQADDLERLLERARREGHAFEDHELHDLLGRMDEGQIDRFIDDLDGLVNRGPGDPMVDVARREMQLGRGEDPLIGGEMDPDLSPVDRITGSPSEAQFSGDLGEGMEAARAGATSLPPTYAQRFTQVRRDELRRIFSESGRDALQRFVRELNLGPSGLRQVEIPTGAGLRRVDRLFMDGETIVLREVKNYPRGILREAPRITEELAKDIAAAQQYDRARIEWDITGNIGQEFLDELRLLEATSGGKFVVVPGTSMTVVP